MNSAPGRFQENNVLLLYVSKFVPKFEKITKLKELEVASLEWFYYCAAFIKMTSYVIFGKSAWNWIERLLRVRLYLNHSIIISLQVACQWYQIEIMVCNPSLLTSRFFKRKRRLSVFSRQSENKPGSYCLHRVGGK